MMTEVTKTDRETGERMVWDIFENCWVTISYWNWVNGR